MKIFRDICHAGKTLIITERPASRRESKQRGQKKNLTSEAVWKVNFKNSVMKLTKLLNHNFVENDHHLQLTYKNEPSLEQGKRDREKFCKELKRQCKKEGIECKWISVSENRGKHRLHHHIICSNIPMRIIKKCWKHGHVFHNPLWEHPNYQQLAEYLLKHADGTFREENLICKKRYNSSRNCIMPETRREELTRVNLDDEVKPFKGYYIDGEVERYEHALTKLTCRSYILVSLEEGHRKRKKGRRIKEWIDYKKLLEEAYSEEQLNFLTKHQSRGNFIVR